MGNSTDESTNTSVEDDRDIIRLIAKGAAALVILALIFSLVLLVAETNFFRTEAGYDLSKMGAWGDTVGGVLNPLFSFLALMGLLWTIRLQSKELGLSRNELELTRKELEGSRQASEKMVEAANQQNIENAFFQLLDLVSDTAGNVSCSYSRGVLHNEHINAFGPEAFEKIENQLAALIRQIWEHHLNGELSSAPMKHRPILEVLSSEKLSRAEKISILTEYSYETIYTKNRASLGIYFRVLYNMLRFLSEKKRDLPTSMYDTYCKIVRAKLSDFELVIIFYNCLTEVGTPMKKYVADFQLFDNLPLDELSFLVDYNEDEFNGSIKETDVVNLLDLSSAIDLESFGRSKDIVATHLSQ